MAKTSQALTPIQAGWLLASGLAAAAPLSLHVPLWLSALMAAILAWRAWLLWRRLPLPKRAWLLLIVVVGTGGVLIEYHTLLGQNPGVALLLLFLALKQMEARTARDALAAIFLAYFLAMAQFFYSQSMVGAIAAGIAIVAATATLASLIDDQQSVPAQLRLAGRLLMQAVPMMLVLFVLFPRVPGPLWGLPKDAHSGITGISDSMSPGSISELVQSDDIAFRVLFAQAPPPASQRYWRGPVLTTFDGRTWRPLPSMPRSQLPYGAPAAARIDYEITLEASGRPWLFALELPASLPADVYASRDYLLLARAPLTERSRYRLSSFIGQPVGSDEAEPLLRAALSLPTEVNPRTRALGESWRSIANSDEEIVRLAATFFRDQHLTYTLLPPLLGRDSADEFLFDSKAGFCEHFASAFAVALRAAGVPTRVVTGYQGGEVNAIDGYLTVRQSDAHAWTEVWLKGRGWQRLDPTAISAPMRVEANVAAAVPIGDPLPVWLRIHAEWLRDLRMRSDALANAWNQWVLGYNSERQRELLQRLGMPSPDWRSMTIALTVASGLVMLALGMIALRRRQRRDPVQALWLRAGRRLARRGLARREYEGPLDYAERVAASRPDLASSIRALAWLYTTLRYGNAGGERLSDFRRTVAAFRP
jgi:transglutaminase-like putative cysteine protease